MYLNSAAMPYRFEIEVNSGRIATMPPSHEVNILPLLTETEKKKYFIIYPRSDLNNTRKGNYFMRGKRANGAK